MNGEKLRIIQAIEASGSSVTASEVCQKSGIALEECQKWLNIIALESGGALLVDGSGSLTYKFQPNIRGGYKQRSLLKAANAHLLNVWHGLFYIFKVSFGFLLIGSLIILVILLTIPCLIIASLTTLIGFFQFGRMSKSNGLAELAASFELFTTGWQYLFMPDSLRAAPKEEEDFGNGLIPDLDDRPRKSFVLDCFSFLFGDGFPNKDYEERKWQALGRLIRHSYGAVIVEQLAPFMAPQGQDEAQALPVLVHFNGRPEVSEGGVIVYTFQEFMDNPSAQDEPPADHIEARRWQFSTVPFNSLWKVWMFSAINFAGYYFLWLNRHHEWLEPYHLFVEIFFVYSCAFVAIPAIRYFCIAYLNTFVDVENELRQALAAELVEPEPELVVRLAERSQFALLQGAADTIIGGAHGQSGQGVIYDSSRDLLEQEIADNLDKTQAKSSSLPDIDTIPVLPEYLDIEHERQMQERERQWKNDKL